MYGEAHMTLSRRLASGPFWPQCSAWEDQRLCNRPCPFPCGKGTRPETSLLHLWPKDRSPCLERRNEAYYLEPMFQMLEVKTISVELSNDCCWLIRTIICK